MQHSPRGLCASVYFSCETNLKMFLFSLIHCFVPTNGTPSLHSLHSSLNHRCSCWSREKGPALMGVYKQQPTNPALYAFIGIPRVLSCIELKCCETIRGLRNKGVNLRNKTYSPSLSLILQFARPPLLSLSQAEGANFDGCLQTATNKSSIVCLDWDYMRFFFLSDFFSFLWFNVLLLLMPLPLFTLSTVHSTTTALAEPRRRGQLPAVANSNQPILHSKPLKDESVDIIAVFLLTTTIPKILACFVKWK